MVTTSFFVPQKPVPTRIGDSRYILTEVVITQSEADFIDLHPYPGWGLNLSQYARNFGITGTIQKPVIMGEFGASTSLYPSANTAARVLRDWQVESCRYGFDGWLLWTWDTEEAQGFWNALSEGGAIEKMLAPVNRPDPCQEVYKAMHIGTCAVGSARNGNQEDVARARRDLCEIAQVLPSLLP